MPGDVVIGIGNPILSDDAVGLKVARHLRKRLPDGHQVSVVELYCGGLQLMEAMEGYDRAVIVDAVESRGTRGTVYSLGMDNFGAARNTCTTHDGSLVDALELGRMTGMRLPKVVFLWGIEGADLSTFSEHLTPAVAAAVPRVTAEIMAELLAGKNRSSRRIAQ